MLLFGAAALVAIAMLSPAAMRTAPVSVLASAQLSDDDGEQALFPGTQLAPGQPVSRCIRVSYQGGGVSRPVRLDAVDVSGSLELQIEQGTGGGFNDCTGFSGQAIYDGTLTGLTGGASGAPGISTGWQPASDSMRTFRFTVRLPAATSQGQLTAAKFRWLIEELPAEPEPTAPTTSPAQPSEPAPTQPSEPAPVQPSGTPAPSDPVNEVLPPAATRKPAAPSASKKSSNSSWATDVTQFVGRAGEAAADILGRTARHGHFPAAVLLIVGAFLLIQARIDRRDPKLALAPLAEEYIPVELWRRSNDEETP